MKTRYTNDSLETIQNARLQLLRGLANPRLSTATRERMQGWIAEAEAELLNRASSGAEIAATPKQATPAAPALYQMRNGSAAPRNAADQNRLQMSYLS
ncbi:MAG: hypothetical protein ACR2OU_18715 [Thermomicrobiales bacterium]